MDLFPFEDSKKKGSVQLVDENMLGLILVTLWNGMKEGKMEGDLKFERIKSSSFSHERIHCSYRPSMVIPAFG